MIRNYGILGYPSMFNTHPTAPADCAGLRWRFEQLVWASAWAWVVVVLWRLLGACGSCGMWLPGVSVVMGVVTFHNGILLQKPVFFFWGTWYIPLGSQCWGTSGFQYRSACHGQRFSLHHKKLGIALRCPITLIWVPLHRKMALAPKIHLLKVCGIFDYLTKANMDSGLPFLETSCISGFFEHFC